MCPIVLLLWRTLTNTNPSLRNVGTSSLIPYSIVTWILTLATVPLTPVFCDLASSSLKTPNAGSKLMNLFWSYMSNQG